MDSIISYVNDLASLIGSFSENLSFDAGSEIFCSLCSVGLNIVFAFAIIFAFALPFLLVFWFMKFIEGVR